MKRGLLGAVMLFVLIFGGLFLLLACTEQIPAGYVGVVYSMDGGVDGETISQGWHLVSPTKRVTAYTVGMEQSGLTAGNTQDSRGDESFNIPTSDGKTVRVSLEFSYRFDEARITDTFIMFKGQSGEQIKDSFIKPKVMAWTQEVSARYPVADIFGDKRTEINLQLDIHLREKFDAYGIVIDTVNFTDISVDEETAAAIQQKVNAQQQQELATIQAETDRINANKERDIARIAAEKEKEVASINAERQIITAQAQADALMIQAEAEADANKKIAASLTAELIEMTKYERWDGVLPKVSGGATPILNVDGI